MRSLADIRIEIDQLDDTIIDLLGQRFGLAPHVVAYKTAHGLPATIQARVDEVINRNVARGGQRNLNPELIRAVYTLIVSEYCRMEDEMMGHP